MTEIKALAKLRKLKGQVIDYLGWGIEFDRAVDDLEAEVAERFMELPVDAEGVPIRVGDVLSNDIACQKQVWMVSEDGFAVYGVFGGYNPKAFTHDKPRTIQSVLLEMVRECAGTDEPTDQLVDKYAAELRGMMEADDD